MASRIEGDYVVQVDGPAAGMRWRLVDMSEPPGRPPTKKELAETRFAPKWVPPRNGRYRYREPDDAWVADTAARQLETRARDA